MSEPGLKGFTKGFRIVVEVFSVLVLLVGGIYGLTSFIDSRIKSVVTDESYVRRIASEVRPSVIFDSKGSILFDQGAMRYLDEIEVVGGTNFLQNFPVRIVLKPKQYLPQPPLLTCLEDISLVVKPERGPKFDWVYPLETSGGTELPVYRFRMEILQ